MKGLTTKKLTVRLSEQQRFILQYIGNKWQFSKNVSWAVARHFNKNGNRIERYGLKQITVRNKNYMISGKFESLTRSHRASFSRAIKRLSKRDLILFDVGHRFKIIELTEKGKQIIS